MEPAPIFLRLARLREADFLVFPVALVAVPAAYGARGADAIAAALPLGDSIVDAIGMLAIFACAGVAAIMGAWRALRPGQLSGAALLMNLWFWTFAGIFLGWAAAQDLVHARFGSGPAWRALVGIVLVTAAFVRTMASAWFLTRSVHDLESRYYVAGDARPLAAVAGALVAVGAVFAGEAARASPVVALVEAMAVGSLAAAVPDFANRARR